jgi:hypothetical protein
MSSDFINCTLGIYACILLYAGSKVLIYWFLIEKVCLSPISVERNLSHSTRSTLFGEEHTSHDYIPKYIWGALLP